MVCFVHSCLNCLMPRSRDHVSLTMQPCFHSQNSADLHLERNLAAKLHFDLRRVPLWAGLVSEHLSAGSLADRVVQTLAALSLQLLMKTILPSAVTAMCATEE